MAAGQDERDGLRALAHGPCKQTCLLFADMAFKAHRQQVRNSLHAERERVTNEFFASPQLEALEEDKYRSAVERFQEKLDATMLLQERRFLAESRNYGVANVKRCMAGCVGLREVARIQEFCDCIEASGDLHVAAQCFRGLGGQASWPVQTQGS